MKARCFISLMVTVAALMALSLPMHASTLDERIELSARESYVLKNYLRDDNIKIESRNGAVTLTGTVAASFNKALVQEIVASISGVASVDNRLEIKEAPPSANSDAWILDKVKATFLFHRSVSSAKTEVNVKDGIITLHGEATSQTQKELMTEYAKDVDGVKDVNNEMVVSRPSIKMRTAGEKIDDASITAQVKMTLLNHRSTSALNSRVETRRGVVTLRGKAGSAAELNLATKYAKDVKGVRGVKNRMTIE